MSNAKSIKNGPRDPKKRENARVKTWKIENSYKHNAGFRSRLRTGLKIESMKTTNEKTRNEEESGLTYKPMKKAHDPQKGEKMHRPKVGKRRKCKKALRWT